METNNISYQWFEDHLQNPGLEITCVCVLIRANRLE